MNGNAVNGSSLGADDIPGLGQYDDFHTIDWQRDIARDRMRHRFIVKKRRDSLWECVKGWVSVVLISFHLGWRYCMLWNNSFLIVILRNDN